MDRQFERALTEPYAFAVLAWPAVIGVFLLSGDMVHEYWRYLLYAWLGIIHAAAYTGGRGIGFGNVMLFTSICIAFASSFYPSPWTLAWLPVVLIGLLAAQRARWQRMMVKRSVGQSQSN